MPDSDPDTETPLICDVDTNPPTASSSMAASSIGLAAKVMPGLFIGAAIANADMGYVIAIYVRIGSDLNQLNNVVWIIVAQQLAYTISHPIYGRLSNVYGRKPCVLIANTLFAVGSLICWSSYSLGQVLVGRVITSAGVAGMSVLVTFVLTDIVPLRNFALWQSIHSVSETVGLVTGSMLGSYIAVSYGWRTVFLMQPALVFIPAFWVFFLLPTSSRKMAAVDTECNDNLPESSSFDSIGVLLLTLIIVTLLSALQLSTSNIGILAALCATSVFAAVAFAYVEIHVSKQPIVPLSFLRQRAVAIVVFTNFVTMVAYSASVFLISFWLQVVLRDAGIASGAGLSLLYVGLAIGFIASGCVIKRTARVDRVLFICCAATSVCYMLLGCGIFDLRFATHRFIILALGVSISGALGSLLVALVSCAQQKKDQALLIGLNHVLFSIGGTISTKATGTILQRLAKSAVLKRLPDDVNAEKILSEVLRDIGRLNGLDQKLQTVIIESLVDSCKKELWFCFAIAVIACVSSFRLRRTNV